LQKKMQAPRKEIFCQAPCKELVPLEKVFKKMSI